jgi:hypothetical protein
MTRPRPSLAKQRVRNRSGGVGGNFRWTLPSWLALAIRDGKFDFQAKPGRKKACPSGNLARLQGGLLVFRFVRIRRSPANFPFLHIFGPYGTAATVRERFESQLALEIADIDRACTLTAAETKKLRLAGQGDIKRFFNRYEGSEKEISVAAER